MFLGVLQEVMQDYRDEIKDFFAVDKQLASELEYDMKKYNEQLAQEQEQARLADGTRTTDGVDGAPVVQVDRSSHLEHDQVPNLPSGQSLTFSMPPASHGHGNLTGLSADGS